VPNFYQRIYADEIFIRFLYGGSLISCSSLLVKAEE